MATGEPTAPDDRRVKVGGRTAAARGYRRGLHAGSAAGAVRAWRVGKTTMTTPRQRSEGSASRQQYCVHQGRICSIRGNDEHRASRNGDTGADNSNRLPEAVREDHRTGQTKMGMGRAMYRRLTACTRAWHPAPPGYAYAVSRWHGSPRGPSRPRPKTAAA